MYMGFNYGYYPYQQGAPPVPGMYGANTPRAPPALGIPQVPHLHKGLGAGTVRPLAGRAPGKENIGRVLSASLPNTSPKESPPDGATHREPIVKTERDLPEVTGVKSTEVHVSKSLGDVTSGYSTCVTPPPEDIMNDLYMRMPPTNHPISPLVVHTPNTGRPIIARSALATPLDTSDGGKPCSKDHAQTPVTCPTRRRRPSCVWLLGCLRWRPHPSRDGTDKWGFSSPGRTPSPQL